MIDDGLLDRIWEALEDAKRGKAIPIIFCGLDETGTCVVKVYDNGQRVTLVNQNPPVLTQNPTLDSTKTALPILEYAEEYEATPLPVSPGEVHNMLAPPVPLTEKHSLKVTKKQGKKIEEE